MNNKNKWILSIFILFVFVGILIVSNRTSNSINTRDLNSISIVKDEHVVPFEKVYVEIDGEVKNMNNVNLLVGNNNLSFKADIKGLQTSKPYFEVPNYGENVVIGLKYFIKEAMIKYNDGRLVRYTTNTSDNMRLVIDEKKSYFVIDEIKDDVNAWRDFKSIDFSDSVFSNSNIYFSLIGNTKEMVDIELEWVRIDEGNSFRTSVMGLGNRTFIDLSDAPVMAGEEYYLKNMTIYYNNGGSYTYSADNYANIVNNRIFIAKELEDSFKKVEVEAEGPTTDGNKPNATNNTNREQYVSGGIIVLFLVVLVAFGIFFYIKDEEE